MADMFDCGIYTFTSWSAGSEWRERWDGPFDPTKTFDNVYTPERKKESLAKLTQEAQSDFRRGWEYAKNQYAHHQN